MPSDASPPPERGTAVAVQQMSGGIDGKQRSRQRRLTGGNVRATDPDTSRQAALGASERGSLLKALLLQLLRARGTYGATDDELWRMVPDQHPGSVSKRRGDCVVEGLVEDSGRRRYTRRDRSAIVWVAVDLGPVGRVLPENVAADPHAVQSLVRAQR